MKFFGFSQNNSGGYFSEPAENVFIQAENAAMAKDIFNAQGFDQSFCHCCGERWSPEYVDDSDGHDAPLLYGEPLQESYPVRWVSSVEIPHSCIIYSDGSRKIVPYVAATPVTSN